MAWSAGHSGTHSGSVERTAGTRRRTQALSASPPVPSDAPGVAAGEAVDGVLLAGSLQRQLIVLAVPGKRPLANAVGEGEEDGDAAARRPAVVEQARDRRRAGRAAARRGRARQRIAVEARRRPDLPPGTRPLQLINGWDPGPCRPPACACEPQMPSRTLLPLKERSLAKRKTGRTSLAKTPRTQRKDKNNRSKKTGRADAPDRRSKRQVYCHSSLFVFFFILFVFPVFLCDLGVFARGSSFHVRESSLFLSLLTIALVPSIVRGTSPGCLVRDLGRLLQSRQA